MKKTIFLWIISTVFLLGQSANFDSNINISTSIDTTQVKIGQEINFNIDIYSKNKYNIRFDENPNFIPFEVLKSYPSDTIIESSKISKKYSLINFEPGEYWIPPQKIYFNQSIKFSDSLRVIINDVEVDTLKQNLFDIKPIIPVKRNYQKLIFNLIIGFLILILIYIIFRFRLFNKKNSSKDEMKSLYQIAIDKLGDLDNVAPNSQIEFKEYYTILIDIFREYLESQVKIPAMESTSRELIIRINMLKDSGNYDFELKQINKLENLFTKSDLIKFAKSLPTKNDINIDISTIKNFIDSTEKIYNEKYKIPDEEEVPDEEKSLLDNLKIFLKYSFLIISTSIILSILIFGYYPVRDTILLNPTKKLLSKDWYTSQYGSPPVELNTPNILVRLNDSIENNKFEMGSFEDSFFLSLGFKDIIQSENPANIDNLKNELINQFQNLGSKNILVKDDQFSLKSGDIGLRFYGSLDIEKNNDLHRSNFTSVVLPYDKKTITLIIVYRDNDRYADKIESKILESFNVIKEL